ncbi:transcription factor Rba50 [Aspergillus nomiae NRRL 13137]|uniref:Transcription factor Rba50 n=1 Tax=Aspergillus nomiae NRRL (strain ATCC 15546 / NRRL 13137 / CBS 260.88 / M93) TaxID=1509407 RepID=A0A0L1IMN9_ASPN3|nr:transcription factor Rba50 [Aspergillus nomiae NRRL 13137]KNG80762.1 transcription factor Rba50 [Aspergillus nomiae NRRL 13137]
MAFRGERFVLDLDSDDDQPSSAPPASSISLPGMIGEIRERSPAAAPAPPKPAAAGFPAHRRRVKQSAFKQRREDASTTNTSTASRDDEKRMIDDENRRQLASMSPDQIQQEREELMASIDPSLLERFLRRARIDSEEPKTDTRSNPSASIKPQLDHADAATPPPEPVLETKPSTSQDKQTHRDDLPPAQMPDDLRPAFESPLPSSVHFPTPPSQLNPMPNLDPSSPSFLSDLQAHYFPNITHDPSSLSWLQPPSADSDAPDATSAYHPASNAEAVHPAALRFSFLGTLLSPTTSLALPTNLGLHHHGKDPHAAGYTIPELAILSRSSFPAQRCIAWQVLGRILFRLGKGQFGERGSTLVEGLWSVIEREGVVASMLAEADGTSTGTTRSGKDHGTEKQGPDPTRSKGGVGHHASATAWAVEGVWLWQMGGSGDRGVLKEGAVRSQ